jgi:sugar lactone lactonase YvrE/enterochelin esterase-like enzyme
MRSLSLIALLAGGLAAAAQDAPPKGDVTKYSFENSKIFPGTYRDYWVYVPKQYDGKTPACVHVNQDGIQFKAPEVFDKLIHEKKMPVTIGVFIMHGRVKAANGEQALDRFNRSYEYDGLGDNYARFLLEELLPDVETKAAPDGRKIVLSKKGNDRAIGGSSSGAICAFTAAWERPEEFSRVFSAIGTYVGLRGGNDYPTLVRKTEPKAIRVFLEDGENDLNIYGGDWWMANQEMERALKFAGYEVEHAWGKGGHNGQAATKLFPEAVEWLWKGWPEPVKAGKGSPNLQNLLVPGEGWKLVGDGYKFTEGPIANAKGELFFTDVPQGKTYKVGEDGKPVEVSADNGRASGFAFGPDGKLYGVGSNLDPLVRYDGDTRVPVAAGVKGNDLVALHNGNFYVTAPNGANLPQSKILLVTAKGERKEVDTGIRFPNGITVSPDQTLLYVAESRTHWVYSFQIQPDGSLKHKQKYFHLHVPDTADEASADGLKCDRNGTLYVATRIGVQFCDQAGRVNGIVPTPNGKCANLAFGGKDFDILYATCGERVYSRKVKQKGANTFDAPFKPKAPGL